MVYIGLISVFVARYALFAQQERFFFAKCYTRGAFVQDKALIPRGYLDQYFEPVLSFIFSLELQHFF